MIFRKVTDLIGNTPSFNYRWRNLNLAFISKWRKTILAGA